MAGPWPWTPCHDLHIIYTSCTILIPWGQNWGVAFPSPFISTFLSALQNWMCQSHGILQLSHSLIQTIVLPLHPYLSNDLIPKHYDLHVEDAQWVSLELSLRFQLNHIQSITWLGSCSHFLRKETCKTLWALVLEGNAILYATGLIFQELQMNHSI